MPYKVGRSSNSKKSGNRVVVETPIAEVPLSVIPEVPSSVIPEVPSSVIPEVPSSFIPEVLPVVEETPPPVEPLFNEDRTKVMNPLTNRYVKVGGDIDKKLNLSNLSF